MFRRPDLLVLDYRQSLLGSTRYWLGLGAGGCPCVADQVTGQARHADDETHPRFVHAASNYWECLEQIRPALAAKATTSSALRGPRPTSNNGAPVAGWQLR
ncbi:unnamed protein product [Prorocentrum cordatum]|uniref:Uncharacterized protein n=1 Tax=Prorocentrum cordatum TaxID=2364126 RepID=A0ABN9UWZ8_9DINO|nr:unnamed protein product [Polarella glacialis]